MSLKDILAAKGAAPAAAPTEQVEEVESPKRDINAAPLYDPVPLVGEAVTVAAEAEPEAEPVPEISGPAGSYRPRRLQRFFKGDGTLVLPVDGFFVPQDQEEYDMLEHYATQWDMVEPQ